MKYISKLYSATDIWRKYGFKVLARAGLHRLVDISEFLVFRRDLSLPAPTAGCSLAFQLKRVDDYSLEQFKNMPEPFPRHYEYRFEYGQRHCYAAYVGGEIVALMWPVFETDNQHVVNRWRYLLADEARIASIWAHPRCRGTGLIDTAMERLILHLAKCGYRYVYEFTWVGNHSAARLYERRGFKIIGKVWNLRSAWQKPGSGLYIRQRLQRDPVAGDFPRRNIKLPKVIS